ncbi:MAG: nicotinate-nucleotide--dimethylbenzimidazole phosphoribosyltransferase [Bacteroidales bacterium]|nr:nicotinate-nucleotide--dimethylbenzimidazole phosphoribosyltransferase [Bacteroidales bacterium]
MARPSFDITLPDESLRDALQARIDDLTKPHGSLGRLEELALQAGLIQHTLSPALLHPQNIIFAADHGIVSEGVTVAPREVTFQQVCHFTHPNGTGGINFLCRQHGFELKVVDAGVDADLPRDRGIIDRKIARGTDNFLYGPAMSPEQFDRCLATGAEIVRMCAAESSNVLSFGEMGIGNTSASSIWMSRFTGTPIEDCVGAGSGLSPEGVRHKKEVLSRAIEGYRGDGAPEDWMRWFGGFEMVMAVGAMLQAAEMHIIILVDGFIMGACMLGAAQMYPAVKAYAVFGHCGDEAGHRRMLDALGARPLLHLGLRLGEGTGALCAYPILDSAVRMINEMDRFSEASITRYF